MLGRVLKIEDEITYIMKENREVIDVKTDFLPKHIGIGSYVELENDKIVLRMDIS